MAIELAQVKDERVRLTHEREQKDGEVRVLEALRRELERDLEGARVEARTVREQVGRRRRVCSSRTAASKSSSPSSWLPGPNA